MIISACQLVSLPGRPAICGGTACQGVGAALRLGIVVTELAVSGGGGPGGVDRPVWGDRTAVGQELAGVVEDDDAVAQQAPSLLGAEDDGAGRAAVKAVSWRAWGLM